MKFTKEEALEKIKAMFSKKVEKIDSWERTIKENIENLCDLLGEESEIELDVFAEKAVKMLETQKGHINKENSTVAEGLKKQIEELKKQIPSKKKKKGEEDDDDDDPNNELEERLKKIEDELKQERTKNTLSQKKSELKAELKKKGVENEKWVNRMLDKISITEETDIESEAESLVEMYNDFVSEETPEGVTPRRSAPQSQLDKIKETIKAAGESREAEEK